MSQNNFFNSNNEITHENMYINNSESYEPDNDDSDSHNLTTNQDMLNDNKIGKDQMEFN